MKVSAALPTGVAALLFESARRRRQLEGDLSERLHASGFSEVILPVVDYLDPYEEMLSARGREELYRFVDRDGDVLALRSDFTPMLARLLAPRLASLELPLKLFYRGDVLRRQEERAGRMREFYQLGAEVLGLPGEQGEALVLRRFLELLTAAGAHRLRVVLGFAGALDRLLIEAGDDDPSALAAAVVRRERARARRAGTALVETVEDGAPADPGALGAATARRLERLRALCESLGDELPDVDLCIDLAEFADQTLDRSLPGQSYYDGLVFRAYAGAAAEPVGAGGRYDRLFRRLGADVTAAGFSLGLDRLARGEEGR